MKGTNLFKLPEQRAIFHSDAATGVSQKSCHPMAKEQHSTLLTSDSSGIPTQRWQDKTLAVLSLLCKYYTVASSISHTILKGDS